MGVCPAAPPSLHSHMISILRGTHTRHASVPIYHAWFQEGRKGGRKEVSTEGRKEVRKEASTEGRKEGGRKGSCMVSFPGVNTVVVCPLPHYVYTHVDFSTMTTGMPSVSPLKPRGER